jgi:hypothetical protein
MHRHARILVDVHPGLRLRVGWHRNPRSPVPDEQPSYLRHLGPVIPCSVHFAPMSAKILHATAARKRTLTDRCDRSGTRHEHPLSELARQHGVDPSIIHARIKCGWSFERALTTPKGQHGRMRLANVI